MKIANCPASGRQLGHVRKSLEKKKWSARFKFNRQGGFKTIDCPVRASRTEAEADRSFVAVAVGQVCRSSRMDAAKHWIQFLRDGGVPSSASTAPEMDPALINTMKKGQLRESASKTHGMIRNKKTSKGKWIPKTCEELRTELLALMASRSTQAMPGRQDYKKKGARWVMKKPSAPTNTTPVCRRI